MGTKLIGRNEVQAIIDLCGLKLKKTQTAISNMAFVKTISNVIAFLQRSL